MYYLQSRYYDANICRFISPDSISYLGTNNDLASYNLYAYCSNDPVMYIDDTGLSIMPFWELSWPGEIHNQLQNILVGMGYQKEVQVPEGRIDIVGPDGKMAYEIKPYLYNTIGGRVVAILQLLRYVLNSEGKYTIGTDDPRLHGSFVSADGKYTVYYDYVGYGLIFYSFKYHKVTDKITLPVVEKSDNESHEVNKIVIGCAIAYAFVQAVSSNIGANGGAFVPFKEVSFSNVW